MAGKYMMFYRREDGHDCWQYGRYRPAGERWMRRNGWRRIRWMEESK